MAEALAASRPLAATVAVLPALFAAIAAAGEAAAADCPTPVAHLVSVVGEVRVNGELPVGTLPAVPVCPGDTVEVGPDSRAGAYLLDADTPLQLDEDTLGRFQPPPEPGSGLVELFRGAVYFLSEVRRTLTIRTPYVTAGVEGTEVYLRAGRPGVAGEADIFVLEGRVALAPGERTPSLLAQAATTGERLAVAADGAVQRSALPGGDGAYAALRRVTVGALSWTLFYPDVLVAAEAQPFPRITDAARLLAAGQVAAAEAVLAGVPAGSGREAGLRDALRSTVAFARKDAAEAARLAEVGRTAAPDAATPLVALSYARQLALDLDGAVAAAGAATEAAPRSPLPRARLAELRLMRGETRAARREARAATDLGGGPLADIALGYAELAALRGGAAEASFRTALAAESSNPLALLGLGLARIKQGHLEEGREQIENAVAHDPSSSLLRSYLGKGYFEERRDDPAGKQLEIAKELDPTDPTPWFYDAIRKQLDNRPVEALRDLERSIELNDNRAPFRSRLLLDRDRAARGVSLARIYDNLGFRQLGAREAGRVLALDPANSGAHRFLADIYRDEPRLEAARVSELLQSQLLQPVGLNPIQPSLAFTDLNIVAAGGPARVSFNEFNPLFQRDGWQFIGSGSFGNDDTRSNELTATTLLGRTSLSIGQFFYDTDGFRKNNQLQNRVYNLFGQAALTDRLDVQAEYRRRESNLGDRSLNFDPDSFDSNQRESIDQDIVRLGGRFEFTPSTVFLLSGAYADRDEHERTRSEFFDEDGSLTTSTQTTKGEGVGEQLEGQLLTAREFGNVIVGGGAYHVDQDVKFTDTLSPCNADCTLEVRTRAKPDAYNIYSYSTVRWPSAAEWTLSLGLDSTDIDGRSSTELTPKLGLDFRLTDRLALRAAVLRTVKRNLVAQQTIEPTTVAGFNRIYDDFNGTKSDQVSVGLDAEPVARLAVGAEATYRELSPPRIDLDGDDRDVFLRDATEKAARGYAYWTVSKRLIATAEVEQVAFRQQRKEAGSTPVEVDTFLAPLSLRYFHPTGFFASTGLTYVAQSVTRNDDNGTTDDGNDGWLLDATVGFRLPNRRGILSLEARNLLDERFRWQDDNFRSADTQNPRFLPEGTVLLRATLTF